jgi:hypothetical protein
MSGGKLLAIAVFDDIQSAPTFHYTVRLFVEKPQENKSLYISMFFRRDYLSLVGPRQ